MSQFDEDIENLRLSDLRQIQFIMISMRHREALKADASGAMFHKIIEATDQALGDDTTRRKDVFYLVFLTFWSFLHFDVRRFWEEAAAEVGYERNPALPVKRSGSPANSLLFPRAVHSRYARGQGHEWKDPVDIDQHASLSDVRTILRDMPLWRFQELPPSHQLLVKAIVESEDEHELSLAIRRIFYQLTAGERYGIVWTSFNDPSPQLGMMRQLIAELPQDQQDRILSGGAGPEL